MEKFTKENFIVCRKCDKALKSRTIFRELAFDLQFAQSDKEKEAIVKEMIRLKDEEKDEKERGDMIKTLGINIP